MLLRAHCGVSLSKKEMAQMIFKFAFYHTITSLCIWIWPVNGILHVGFSWHSSGRVWKGWSEADLMLGSSRLAGFGPLRTQGTMTTSLCERSHGGHVTQRGYCMRESTPLQGKKGHFHSLVIYDVSLKWNLYSSWIWSPYLDCSWHFGVFRRLGLKVKRQSFDVHQRFHETCLL